MSPRIVRNSSKFCKVAPKHSGTHERKKDGGDRWIVSQVDYSEGKSFWINIVLMENTVPVNNKKRFSTYCGAEIKIDH